MLLYAVYSTGPIFAAVAWTRDERGGEVGIDGAIVSQGAHKGKQWPPSDSPVSKMGVGSDSGCMVNEGHGMQQGWGWGQVSSVLVMTMLGREKSLIVVILHIENRGCMEMEDISDLGRAVGTDDGVEQGWRWQGHRCLCCCHLGVFRCTLGSRTNAQMDTVIAGLIGCLGSNLAAALLLTPFHLPLPSPACSPSSAHALPSSIPFQCSQTLSSPLVVIVIVALCVFIVIAIAECSFPLIPVPCLQMAPDLGSSTSSVVVSVYKINVHERLALMSMPGMLGRGISENGTSLEVMDGRASLS